VTGGVAAVPAAGVGSAATVPPAAGTTPDAPVAGAGTVAGARDGVPQQVVAEAGPAAGPAVAERFPAPAATPATAPVATGDAAGGSEPITAATPADAATEAAVGDREAGPGTGGPDADQVIGAEPAGPGLDGTAPAPTAGPATAGQPAPVTADPSAGTAALAGVAAPAGPAATNGPAPVAAPAAATAASAPAGPPAEQIATRIVPLRLDGDGVHRLTVHLHPADLGMVSVVAEIRDGAINVQLAGATEAGRESLRGALPDLRRELQQAGFTGCTLDLRQDTPQGGQQQFRAPLAGRAEPSGSAGSATAPDQLPVRPSQGGARRLDLHV